MGIILNSGTCYEFDVNSRTDSQKTQVVTFSEYLRYYQKNINAPGGDFKNGVASIGHSLTWGRKGDAFVIGAPNFNLGEPTKTVKNKITNTVKDKRYGGFGNIVRFGKVSGREAQIITQNKRVLMNPSKGRGRTCSKIENESKKSRCFRENLKKDIKDAEQGTPALYLGWAVITGNIIELY